MAAIGWGAGGSSHTVAVGFEPVRRHMKLKGFLCYRAVTDRLFAGLAAAAPVTQCWEGHSARSGQRLMVVAAQH